MALRALCTMGATDLLEDGAGEQKPLVEGGALRSRWLMLTLFSFVAASNAFMFMSFASVAHLAAEHYNTSMAGIHGVAQAVYLGYVLVVPMAMIFSSRGGLRIAMVVAAVLNAVGAVFRAFHGLLMMNIGSFLVGVSLAFFIGAPTWLSATWFGGEERHTASAVCILATQAGLALGYVVPPLMITEEDYSITVPLFNYITAGVCVIIGFAVVFGFGRDPGPKPDNDGCITWPLPAVFANKDLLLVLLQFGITTAIYWCFALMLSSALYEKYSTRQIGLMGSLYLCVGLFSMGATGAYFDRRAADPPYRVFIASALALSTLLMAAFTYFAEQGDMFVMTTVVAVALGLVLPTVQSVYLELAVEYTFPEVPEEISGSLLYLGAMLIGFFLPFLIEPPKGHKRDFLFANIGLTVAIGVCAALVPALSGNYKRLHLRK